MCAKKNLVHCSAFQSAYGPYHSTEWLFWKLLMICSFRLSKVICLQKLFLDILQQLTQLITLSLYAVSILTFDLMILSFNDFHFNRLITHGMSLYLIILLLSLIYIQVFLRVQFLVLCISTCILSFCLPLLTHTLSCTINLMLTHNYRCLLPLTRYPSYLTRCIHA